MPEPYTPSAPTGVGTDDYRCFLLDPELDQDAYLTGTNVLPGNPDVVHHVILFRVPPDQVAQAEAAWTPGAPGRAGPASAAPVSTTFQATSTTRRGSAPGRPAARSRCSAPGTASRSSQGSRIVMQVHYNLLAGDDPDVSATQLRLAPADADLTEPRHHAAARPRSSCPAGPSTTTAPLCDRDAAVADVKERFGDGPGSTADVLYFLCGGRPRARRGAVVHPHAPRADDDHGRRPATCTCSGRSIRIEVNPGTDRAQHRARHPGLGLRQPGRQAGRAGPARRRRHGQGHLPARAVAARPAARRSRASRTGTSCGARAPPTRCAWASCRSPAPERP